MHVRVQQRNGRKSLTTVQGINPKVDLKKVVKGLKGKFKMSKKAMAIVNSFAADLFDRGPKRHVSPWVHLLPCSVSLARPAAFRPHRIAGEAGRLAKHTGAKTLSSAGMQAACRLQGAQGTRSRAPLFARQRSFRATP